MEPWARLPTLLLRLVYIVIPARSIRRLLPSKARAALFTHPGRRGLACHRAAGEPASHAGAAAGWLSSFRSPWFYRGVKIGSVWTPGRLDGLRRKDEPDRCAPRGHGGSLTARPARQCKCEPVALADRLAFGFTAGLIKSGAGSLTVVPSAGRLDHRGPRGRDRGRSRRCASPAAATVGSGREHRPWSPAIRMATSRRSKRPQLLPATRQALFPFCPPRSKLLLLGPDSSSVTCLRLQARAWCGVRR